MFCFLERLHVVGNYIEKKIFLNLIHRLLKIPKFKIQKHKFRGEFIHLFWIKFIFRDLF